MKTNRRITRRGFMKGALAATTGFMIVPGHVLGLGGRPAPSERLNIAGIGVGGRGGGVMNEFASENIVALCDVDSRHAAGTFRRYEQAARYADFRVMLDKEKNLDGVVISTPDHTHAVASLNAIRRGLHVYCEKPLTQTVWEAREVATAARQHKVATQMGNQGQASDATRQLSELVWSGAIGPVRQAHIWTDRPARGLFDEYWPQGRDRPQDTPAVPSHLDWDLWLGPAAERPYHPIYAPFNWRGWWDFGTGALGDIGCHAFDPVFRALKPGHPESVQAASTRGNNETYPLASIVTYRFPARENMPPLELTWYDGGLRPPRPKELPDGHPMGASGRLLIGDDGIILGNRIFPEKRAKEVGTPPQVLPRSVGHFKEWTDACRGGEAAGSNFDWAGPLTEVVLLGNIALRVQLREALTRTALLWDGSAMKVTNLSEANQFLRREYREGWAV